MAGKAHPVTRQTNQWMDDALGKKAMDSFNTFTTCTTTTRALDAMLAGVRCVLGNFVYISVAYGFLTHLNPYFASVRNVLIFSVVKYEFITSHPQKKKRN